MSDPAAEFDGPWKEALDLYFRQFVELLFPAIHPEIDWDRPIGFQDKELQQIAPTAAVGRGTVDKLATVWTRRGEQECVFVHVEVQTQTDPELARRMYQYNHRLEDKYGPMPVSLAVLGDYGRGWRPTGYQAGRWGCAVAFTFPVAKLADWRDREPELEQSPNPFAGFILAHLKTVETDGAPADRLSWKLRLVTGLYDRGVSRTDILQMFRLIDWMMTLPPDLSKTFATKLVEFEKEKEMPIITPTERVWLDQGRTEGRTEGRAEGHTEGILKGRLEGSLEGLLKGRIEAIEAILDIRFGAEGLALMPLVRRITDPGVLEQLLRASKSADLDAFRKLLPPPPQA